MPNSFLKYRKIAAWMLVGLLAFIGLVCAQLPKFGIPDAAEPAPTPDPYPHFRAILQPAARGDIEAAGPLPRYHITAQLGDDPSVLNGVVQVVIPQPGPEILFRLYPNLQNYGGSIKVTRAQINGIEFPAALRANNTAVALAIPPEIVAAPPLTATLNFTTRLPNSTGAPYTLFGWNGDVLSLPGFFPALAVRQNGNWVVDEPPPHADVLFNEAALYQLDLTLPAELVVVSGGAVLNSIDNSNGSRTWQIAGGPLRDLTVIAGPFESVSESAAGARVTSYFLPGHQSAGQLVLAHAAASLRLYSDTFGPYPYTQFSVVEAPLGARGMEYSGLILLGDELYARPGEFLTFLTAHETAHQWWYGLVGNNPYRHPWLDEGLTEYSAFEYYRGVFGRDAAEELLTGRWQIPFETAAAGGVTGQIDRPAVEFDPLSYELLVYGKAALFFNAVRLQLGDEMYLRVLQTYAAENRYQIATPQTFLATAERVSGQNLNPLAERWLK